MKKELYSWSYYTCITQHVTQGVLIYKLKSQFATNTIKTSSYHLYYLHSIASHLTTTSRSEAHTYTIPLMTSSDTDIIIPHSINDIIMTSYYQRHQPYCQWHHHAWHRLSILNRLWATVSWWGTGGRWHWTAYAHMYTFIRTHAWMNRKLYFSVILFTCIIMMIVSIRLLVLSETPIRPSSLHQNTPNRELEPALHRRSTLYKQSSIWWITLHQHWRC